MRGVWKVAAVAALATATFGLSDADAAGHFPAHRWQLWTVLKEVQVEEYC
jgi:hypothetical protein